MIRCALFVFVKMQVTVSPAPSVTVAVLPDWVALSEQLNPVRFHPVVELSLTEYVPGSTSKSFGVAASVNEKLPRALVNPNDCAAPDGSVTLSMTKCAFLVFVKVQVTVWPAP